MTTQTQTPPTTTSSTPSPILVWICYALIVLGFPIISLIIAYIDRSSVQIRNAYLATHYNWIIHTFWWSILWTIICAILCVFSIGYIGFLLLWIWLLYRGIKGAIKLSHQEAIN